MDLQGIRDSKKQFRPSFKIVLHRTTWVSHCGLNVRFLSVTQLNMFVWRRAPRGSTIPRDLSHASTGCYDGELCGEKPWMAVQGAVRMLRIRRVRPVNLPSIDKAAHHTPVYLELALFAKLPNRSLNTDDYTSWYIIEIKKYHVKSTHEGVDQSALDSYCGRVWSRHYRFCKPWDPHSAPVESGQLSVTQSRKQGARMVPGGAEAETVMM